MPWNLEYLAKDRAVRIVASGTVTSSEARRQAQEALAMLLARGAQAVVIDYSEALSEVTFPSLLLLADDLEGMGVPRTISIALVLPKSGYRLDSYHFFETTLQNRLFRARLFQDGEQALAWVRGGAEG